MENICNFHLLKSFAKNTLRSFDFLTLYHHHPSRPMSSSAVAVSAPGKVLFAGGFLVLDRKHTGLVFGLNARIHVHVEAWSMSDKNELSHEQGNGALALVQSPQFQDARWLYKTGVEESSSDQAIQVIQLTG